MGDIAKVKGEIAIWENKGSIWCDWMNRRYMKGRGVEEIIEDSSDSAD